MRASVRRVRTWTSPFAVVGVDFSTEVLSPLACGVDLARFNADWLLMPGIMLCKPGTERETGSDSGFQKSGGWK